MKFFLPAALPPYCEAEDHCHTAVMCLKLLKNLPYIPRRRSVFLASHIVSFYRKFSSIQWNFRLSSNSRNWRKNTNGSSWSGWICVAASKTRIPSSPLSPRSSMRPSMDSTKEAIWTIIRILADSDWKTEIQIRHFSFSMVVDGYFPITFFSMFL